MDNKAKIMQLQQSALSMREEMTVLKEKLGCMLQSLEAEELLKEEQADVLKQHMEHLLVSQEAFLKECTALQFINAETSLVSWENVLEEQLRSCEKDVYRKVIDFVCGLQVSNAGITGYLEQLQDEVKSLDVNAMSKEELSEALEKYMSLEETFFEKDEKKRFMRVMALSSSFNTEFLYCINSGELTLGDESSSKPEEKTETIVEETAETEGKFEPAEEVEMIAEETVETEGESEPAEEAETIAEETVETEGESQPIEEVETIAEEVIEIEVESGLMKQLEAIGEQSVEAEIAASEEIPIIELDSALMSQAMISESSLNFIEEKSEKEDTRFYAKDFHADVCGSSERRKCMSKAFEMHGITPRLMANIMGKSELLYEGACSSLFRNGYFRRYCISGYEAFYYLSKKGYEAFKSEEAVVYLQTARQQDDTAYCQHDSLSVLTGHYIETAINYIHEDPRAEDCIYEIIVLQKNAFAIIFTYGKGETEQRLMIAGIASERERDFQMLFGKIRQYADIVNRYVIYGAHETQAQAVAALLLQTVGDGAVAYTIGDSEIYYDFMTQNMVDILADLESVDEAGTEEIPRAEAVSSIAENFPTEGSAEIPQDEEMAEPGEVQDVFEKAVEEAAQTEVQDIPEKAEWSEPEGYEDGTKEAGPEEIDEEMDLEIPTITLDVHTVAYSPLSDFGTTSEEEYESAYCQMLCDGKVYCATAYLKAAAMEEPALKTEYRQLAYAVNDPMETCSYTADKLSEIYLTDTANTYYFASAMLRLLFFDHETDTRQAKKILPSLEDEELLRRYSGLKRLIHALMDYKDENQTSIGHYGVGTGVDKKVRDDFIAVMIQTISELAADRHGLNQKHLAGNAVLAYTLTELKRRLDGSYSKLGNKYFYMGFLTGDIVLLDAGFMPVLEGRIPLLPQLSPTDRIMAHSRREVPKDEALLEILKQRLENIVNDGGDFSSAHCIMRYIKDAYPQEAKALDAAYNLEIAASKAKKTTELIYNRFIGNLELCRSYRKPENTEEKETMLWTVDRWYSKTEETLNFGFFKKILCALNEKTDEDLLKPLQKGDIGRVYENEQVNYLEDFWETYENIYSKMDLPGYTLQMLLERNGIYEDCVKGQCLADSWLKNAGNAGEDGIKELMLALGFRADVVSQQPSIDEKLENYLVMLKKPDKEQGDKYTHPVSAFGSQAEKDGFCVVCLHGMHDSDNLVEIFQEIGTAKHCLILLDHALPMAERRSLARKAKQAANGRIYAVLDRVALVYLMKHYQENMVNRMLMAITMPFTTCQPYVVDFSKGMPQEIFIGRRTELAQVKAPDGVNIVYGGRHLGKSALLRMARKVIDHDENHNRAALINIKGMNFRRAVKNVYKEMCREGILAEGKDVEEWDVLAALIGERLEQEQDAIPYLLLLLDEADAFIKSCAASAYAPITELEMLQIKYQGRFKFVIAGLKNVVRFEETMGARKNNVFPMLKSLTVKPFKYEDAREMLEVPLSYLGFSVPEKEQTEAMISTVFRTTHYLPGMLQLYCSMLLNPEDVNRMYNEKNVPPYELRIGHMKRILADMELHKKIKDELRATLRVDDEGYYYMIALLAAVWHHTHEDMDGCDAGDILHMAKQYKLARIQVLGREQIDTLMQEMHKLNALQKAGEGRYRISGFRFYQLMGTEDEIKNKLKQYITSV